MAVRKSNPSTTSVAKGTVIGDLIAIVNSLSAKHNALCAKLDADAGVTDTNYNATQGGVDSISLRGGPKTPT